MNHPLLRAAAAASITAALAVAVSYSPQELGGDIAPTRGRATAPPPTSLDHPSTPSPPLPRTFELYANAPLLDSIVVTVPAPATATDSCPSPWLDHQLTPRPTAEPEPPR